MQQIYVRTPGEATQIEREALVRLVVEGGAVTEANVRQGLQRAEALVFCTEGPTVIGVAALKVPKPRYRDGLASNAKSGCPLPEARYPRELGYVAVDVQWRRQGTALRLCDEVIRLADGRGLLATTGADAMRDNILPRLGFTLVKKSWQGRQETVWLMLREPTKPA